MQKYNKFILAGIAGAVAILNSFYGNGNEAVAIIIAVATPQMSQVR